MVRGSVLVRQWRQGMALADELAQRISATRIGNSARCDESSCSIAKMGSRIASSCPPMTLREREVLNATQLGFLIPPLPSIFQASATQVLTKTVCPLKPLQNPYLLGFKLLKAFINYLLSTIHYDNSSTEVPNADCWGLEGNEDSFIDLDSWDPRQTSQDVYKVIAIPVMGDPGTLTPIHPQWAILGGGLWPSHVKSIQLPSREVFEIRGSHLLLVIHCRVKVRVSNRKTKIEETRNSILIPADLKVVDLVKPFKVMGNISGIFEIPDPSSNIRTTDARTATDLGWRHGTELRLEML